MKNIICIVFSVVPLLFISCEDLSKPDVYEKAYLKATLSNSLDTVNINNPIIIKLNIPTELHTVSNKTYTLTSTNVKNLGGYIVALKDYNDTSSGNSIHGYNGFYENNEWKEKIYINQSNTYPHEYSIQFIPKESGIFCLSFNYPIDIILNDADKQVSISTYVDFDVVNKHQDMITNKYTSWQSYVDKLNNDKIGFYVFYVKP